MPKLTDDLWIEGGYYIDFDPLGQLRIIGPNNHLYCGLIDIPRHKLEIDDVVSVSGENNKTVVHVKGRFIGKSINFYYPAMEDIRTLREIIFDGQGNRMSFLQFRRRDPTKLTPAEAKHEITETGTRLVFRRFYGEFWYGTDVIFDSSTEIQEITEPYLGYVLKNEGGEIKFLIEVATNDVSRRNPNPLSLDTELDLSGFSAHEEKINAFWERTKISVEHLINWGKTSGDNFGTVFPRDWLESLILGEGDISPEIASYMLDMTLAHVSDDGEGWHEAVVGEYKYEYRLAGKEIIDRKMIDIEPLYLIALNFVSRDIWRKKETIEKLKKVAAYVIRQASKKDFITFKELPEESKSPDQKYHIVGNWRDSEWAFKRVHQVIAPFDVNAVFYPQALGVIAAYSSELGVDEKEVKNLLEKWSGTKKLYEFINDDTLPAYCLALYDTKDRKNFKQFNVNHLDESYLYLLDNLVPKKTFLSFVERLTNPNYFHTPSGPLLVSKNAKPGYTPQDYHGLTVWTKQAAFTVAGLANQLRNEKLDLSTDERFLIRRTAIKICETMIESFCKLNTIPELHIDKNGEPGFYTGTTNTFVMSKVQLWSAIGARRIFREYVKLLQA